MTVCCSDAPVVQPVVRVYPAASRAPLKEKSSLLCVASDMFPPLVHISWKRRGQDGGLEELQPADGEQLEVRGSGRTTSILLVQRRENSTDRYHCSVRHEGGVVEAPTDTGKPGVGFVWSSD